MTRYGLVKLGLTYEETGIEDRTLEKIRGTYVEFSRGEAGSWLALGYSWADEWIIWDSGETGFDVEVEVIR